MDKDPKLRPLYLAQILYERTDEDHYLTTAQLMEILEKEYGITEMPVFAMNEYGKPFLSGHTDIWFNISHSQKTVVCAVADRPVGVDIQDIRPLNMRVGEKFMTEAEEAAVKSITDPDELNRELCRLWCIKESYGKMTGKGFGEGFKKVETDRLIAENRVSVTERG